MLAFPDRLRGVLAVIVVASTAGCSRSIGVTVDVGPHRVRLVVPRGWERLDHGRQQLFRRDELELSLTDLGPASSAGLVREIEAAETLWRAGLAKDAFARVRELTGPPLHLSSGDQQAAFWGPWNDAALGDRAPQGDVERAFAALIEGTRHLRPITPELQAEYAFDRLHDTQRAEVARRERRTVNGSQWVVLESWNRVSHLGARRLAVLDDRNRLLVLDVERGPIEQTGPAFEALLGSIRTFPESR